jgi:asparagine synthase (glutamine-hydrolysing)
MDAVRIRMRTDVPLGITLSAGIDSNSIAYSMQRVNAAPHHSYTSTFIEERLTTDSAVYAGGSRRINEFSTAKIVASQLGMIPHVVETDYTNLVQQLSQIIWHLESGNSSPAVIPLMQLLREARRHVTVVMDGQGADELLGGYVASIIWQSVADSIAAGKLREAKESISEYSKSYRVPYSLQLYVRGLSNQLPVLSRIYEAASGIRDLFGPALRGGSRIRDYPALNDHLGTGRVNKVLRHQHSGGLVNLLHYGDAISMANGIESRMPFLDHRLVDFAWRLPASFKLRRGVGKYIHREAMRGLVPDWLIDDRVKFGFNSPIAEQFKKNGTGYNDPFHVLISQRCLQRGLFAKRGLSKLIANHKSGARDHGNLLFRMLSTEIWFRTFIDRNPET